MVKRLDIGLIDDQKLELAALVESRSMQEAARLLIEYLGYVLPLKDRVSVLVAVYKEMAGDDTDRSRELTRRYGS